MSATLANKRQMELLRTIAKACNYRTDRSTATGFIMGSLYGTKHGGDGINLFDYDSMTLMNNNLIIQTHISLDTTIDSILKKKRTQPATRITTTGLIKVAELEQSWWKRAIDKQPITFVQVIITIIPLVLSGISLTYAYFTSQQLKQQQAQIQSLTTQAAPATATAPATSPLTNPATYP